MEDLEAAEFYLEIENKRLRVDGRIPYRTGYGIPEIALNRNAVVYEMQLNGQRKFGKRVHEPNDYFVSYYLNLEEHGTIHIAYETPVEGWDNCIRGDLIAISLYSHAFPAYLPCYIKNSICYLKSGFEGYEVYEAYLDRITGLYAKKTKKLFGEIVNIIGIPKEQVRIYQQGKIQVIYRDDCNCESVFESVSIGLQAFQYYREIFFQSDISKIDVVVLGNGDLGGAYNREHLIVLGEPPASMPTEELKNMLMYQMFAHELGHIWFGRAEVSGFEDWLNETGAEWSALLFLLHIGKKDMFDKWIAMHYDNHRRLGEAIRPKDFHHPDAIHDSGVVLFHMLYEKYGENAVLCILQILSKMEQQNTDAFLAQVEGSYSKEIADFIWSHLDEKIEV